MGNGSKNLEKSVEDVFKSGMDEMIRARAELEAAEAEQSQVSEVVEPTPSPELNPTGPPMQEPMPTGPPMPAIAPAADPLIAPPTPTGPPMQEPMPTGPPMMGGPGAMPPMGGPSGPMPPMMGGPGTMPPMGGPSGPMPPMMGNPMPSSVVEKPAEISNLVADSSAMPPMAGPPMISDEPKSAEPVIQSTVEIQEPEQIIEKVQENFDEWDSHFDNEWSGKATVLEGENEPPKPEVKFEEVAWDPNAKPIKTIPPLPSKTELNKMKKADIVALADARDVSTDGTKNDLIQRLLGLTDEIADQNEEAITQEVSENVVEETISETPEEEKPEMDSDPLLAPITKSSETVDIVEPVSEETPEMDSDPLLAPLTKPLETVEDSEPMPPAGPPSGPGPMPPAGPPKGPKGPPVDE